MLELGKAVCFFVCVLSLCQAAMQAFFIPGARWQERLLTAVVQLALAACVCFISGLLFTLPLRTNPDRGRPLSETLPVRLFFWSAACIAGLFLVSWYLLDLIQQASPFISDRTLQRF